jgi:N-acyl-D-amino-acid deacylase
MPVAMKKYFTLFLLFPLFSFAQNIPCDILIKNGKIIDGTGNSWYYGNIAVKDGKIIKVGRDVDLPAKKIINATGLIVAPGFIDVHTHLEGDETKDINATNFILDGVTTCITATAVRLMLT